MESRGSAIDVDDVFKDFSDYLSDEIPAELPRRTKSLAPSRSPLYATTLSASASSFQSHSRRSVRGLKNLEHAPPGEPMPSPRLPMVDSSVTPPVVSARIPDVAPGAFSVSPPSRNTASSRSFRSPLSSYDTSREFADGESNQGAGVRNSAGAHIPSHDSSRTAVERGLYTVEAQRVPDGNEEGTVMVPEAQYARMIWNLRVYRWIFVYGIVIACGLLGTVVVLVVLLNRAQSAASSSSLTSSTTDPINGAPTTVPINGAPTTPDQSAAPLTPVPITGAPRTPVPTSSTQEQIACDFLSIPNETICLLTYEFSGRTTNGSKIPSEIGLLTQLMNLDFGMITLTSTIPSEIGLLTQLTNLDFGTSALASTIPSEIGLLKHLETIRFSNNLLAFTIPTEIGLMKELSSLDFSNSKMISTIPSEIGLLIQLIVLDFTTNNLSSTIPSEIGLLTHLTSLSFNGNWLTATIPSEIAFLPHLTSLDFGSNTLTSTIPSEIGLLTQLRHLDCSDNSLNGTMPSSLCSLADLNGSIYIDCGEITCASGCCMDASSSSLCI